MTQELPGAMHDRSRSSPLTGLRAAGLGLLVMTAMAASAAPSLAAGGPPPPPKGWEPGWIVKPPAYLGRYKLVSSVTKSGNRVPHASGELTLFLQTAYATSTPTPSGILNLRTGNTDVVVYLTELDHDGAKLESLVHGGAFVAPADGKFTVSKLANGKLVGTLTQKGAAAQILTFKRFSKKPSP